MVKFTVVHDLSCNTATYWQLYKSTTFNDEIYKASLPFGTVALVEQTENASEIIRKTSGAPNANLPEPMKSFVGSAFGWVVDTRVDKATNVWTFKWIPNQHADVLKIGGSVKVEPLGASSVRCTADITAEANVFGIGGAIEAFLQWGFYEGWMKGAEFINKWIADGKPIA